MTGFGAKLRNFLFCVVMISSLIAFVLPSSGKIYDYSSVVAILSTIVYVIVGLISIIVKSIRRARMDETDKMKEALLGFVVTLDESAVVDFFRRLTFWGFIALAVISAAGLDITKLSQNENVYIQSANNFYGWALLAFIFSFVVSILHWIFYMPHMGEGSYTIFQYLGKLLKADILTPFRVIKNLFSPDAPRGRSIFYFLVMVLFIAFVAFCVLVMKGII